MASPKDPSPSSPRNYAAEYQRRLRRRRPGESVREATGHDRPEVRQGREVPALLEGFDSWVIVRSPSPGDASRISKYQNLVKKLQSGQIRPEAFQRRVSAWRPLESGQRFLSDPQRVLAIEEARRAREEPLPQYKSGRSAS